MALGNLIFMARLRAWKQGQKALCARFDANHDGRIDMMEWETARRIAAQEIDAVNQRVIDQRSPMMAGMVAR